MRLILVRHGQTASNISGLLDTEPPGPGLTEFGRRQAAALPAALSTESVGAVFASNQLRAQQTAEPLATSLGLDVGTLPGLREIDAGDLEMAADEAAVTRYIGTLRQWLAGDLTRRIPGGPNGREVLDRFDAAVACVVAAVGADGSAVAVSHGAAIRFWTAVRAANLGGHFGQTNHLTNTGAVILDSSRVDGWQMVSWSGQALGGPELTRRVGIRPVLGRDAVVAK